MVSGREEKRFFFVKRVLEEPGSSSSKGPSMIMDRLVAGGNGAPKSLLGQAANWWSHWGRAQLEHPCWASFLALDLALGWDLA